MPKKIKFIVLFFFTCLTVLPQGIGSSYETQKRNLLINNVIGNGILTGSISLLHKKENKTYAGTFLKGFITGCGGGYLMYQGKKSIHKIYETEKLEYNLYSKLLFSLGESLSENAAANRPPFERFHYSYLLCRLDVDFNKNKPLFNIRGDILQIYPLVLNFSKGYKFDINNSLKSGVFFFDSRKELRSHGLDIAGYSEYGTVVVNYNTYDKFGSIFANKYIYAAYSHELVHNLQWSNFTALNSLLIFEDDKKQKKEIVNFGVYLSPWPILFKTLYLTEGFHSYKTYYRNYFEFEAEFFSTNQRVIIE